MSLGLQKPSDSNTDAEVLGISTYNPAWVKKDAERFPRAMLRKGGDDLKTGEVLSIFEGQGREADAKAFERLMAHIKEIDEAFSTVIMIQVENEVGLLGDSRDRSEAANKVFSEAVPANLVDFLTSDRDALRSDLKENLTVFEKQLQSKSNQGWAAMFGEGTRTDELFMAYHYSHYVNEIAARGKAIYPLPMYTNVWQNYVDETSDNAFPVIAGGGGTPGDYPSGGGTRNVLDIWLKFATSLDFIAPDVYLNNYTASCAAYRHRDQPLFIPEQRRDEYGVRRIWIAYGTFAALGTSPFGIDTLEPSTNPFTKHYGLLKSVSAIVLEAQRHPGESVGFCFDELKQDGSDPNTPLVRHWGGYEIVIERCFVFGRPGTGAGMVIHRGNGVMILIGWGFQVRAKSLSPKATFTGFLRFEEKVVVNEVTGELRTAKVLNGDETRSGKYAMMPNEDPDYGGFPICVTIPARTMIAELEVYSLEKK